MNPNSSTDLRDFYRFVGDKIQSGECDLSPEEILDEWRAIHPNPAALEEDIAAIQEAIDAIEAGDKGISLEEFDRRFRAEFKLPEQPDK